MHTSGKLIDLQGRQGIRDIDTLFALSAQMEALNRKINKMSVLVM